MMKAIGWTAGLVGILVGAIGVLGGLRGNHGIHIIGRAHAPLTLVMVGLLLLAVGIWAAVIGKGGKE